MEPLNARMLIQDLRFRMYENDWQQLDIAIYAGIDYSHLNRIFNGKVIPRLDTYLKIYNAMLELAEEEMNQYDKDKLVEESTKKLIQDMNDFINLT